MFGKHAEKEMGDKLPNGYDNEEIRKKFNNDGEVLHYFKRNGKN